MKRVRLVVLVAVFVVLVAVLAYVLIAARTKSVVDEEGNVVGQAYSALGKCTDTDKGFRPYFPGAVKINGTVVKVDRCGGSSLDEYYCAKNSSHGSSTVLCKNGCKSKSGIGYCSWL